MICIIIINRHLQHWYFTHFQYPPNIHSCHPSIWSLHDVRFHHYSRHLLLARTACTTIIFFHNVTPKIKKSGGWTWTTHRHPTWTTGTNQKVNLSILEMLSGNGNLPESERQELNLRHMTCKSLLYHWATFRAAYHGWSPRQMNEMISILHNI